MRLRVAPVASLVAAMVLSLLLVLVPTARGKIAALGAHGHITSPLRPSPAKDRAAIVSKPAPPLPRLAAPAHPASIKPPVNTSFFGWALFDKSTGVITGSANMATGTNTTESMVKAWIAADYLRQLGQQGKTPTKAALSDLTKMIIHSDDNIAQKYYEADGGDAVIQRLISMCGLTNTTIFPYWWSKTAMTPQNAVRYGQCVANGTAAGKKWTPWLLDTMKHVEGGVKDQISVTMQGGHWGIIDGLPANLVPDTSIKNGWTYYAADGWHVNCLAINPAWVLAVMVRVEGNAIVPSVPASVCQSVARQLTRLLTDRRTRRGPAQALIGGPVPRAFQAGPPTHRPNGASRELPERGGRKPVLPGRQLVRDTSGVLPGEATKVRNQNRTVLPVYHNGRVRVRAAASAHAEGLDLSPADNPTAQVVATGHASRSNNEPVSRQDRKGPEPNQQHHYPYAHRTPVALTRANRHHAQAEQEPKAREQPSERQGEKGRPVNLQHTGTTHQHTAVHAASDGLRPGPGLIHARSRVVRRDRSQPGPHDTEGDERDDENHHE